MEKVTAHIGEQNYTVTVQTVNNSILIDEPIALGGQDLGLNPKEILTASLASCTLITLKMYANLKGWNLTDVKIEVIFDWIEEESKSIFMRKIELVGDLNDEQKNRLLKIADKCPIHKILSNSTQINTSFI